VNYVITAKRGIEMFDLHGEGHSRNNWARATCRVGVTPANGLIYAPPHSCGCYMEAQLYGFWALAAERRTLDAGRGPRGGRLEKGSALGAHVAAGPAADAGWPTYRADAARSGSTGSSVPTRPDETWRAELGGRLSAPTVASGSVFVAQIDAHTVHALDAESGRPVWSFTAGGRVDSPPTWHSGLVLFGSRDGWVYCLRASDGELAWRSRAAPQRMNAVAYEQIESLWPVGGSVLVKDGVAYVAAGRSSYLDGGIDLYALDPASGEVLSRRHVQSEHVGAIDPPKDAGTMAKKIRQNWLDYKTFLAPDRSDSFAMRGALTDVLVAEGSSVFMRHMRFDRNLAPEEGLMPHLFATASLLDGAEHHRSYWVLGTGDFNRLPVAYPWILARSIQVPFGLMMSFDEKTVWCVRRIGKKGVASSYALLAAARPDPADPAGAVPDFRRRAARRAGPSSWKTALPFRPRAMIRAGDVVVVGGIPARGRGGHLHVASSASGETLGTASLPSPPVWDGMAAAGGRLYVALRNGTVLCMGGAGDAGAAGD
jgi:hypothetical protein